MNSKSGKVGRQSKREKANNRAAKERKDRRAAEIGDLIVFALLLGVTGLVVAVDLLLIIGWGYWLTGLVITLLSAIAAPISRAIAAHKKNGLDQRIEQMAPKVLISAAIGFVVILCANLLV
jgi:membrane protein implicated in regulation of membrane protease activity